MNWEPICHLSDIPHDAGIAALIKGKQIALFQVQKTLYATDNFDPISRVNSLSRGIVGCIDRQPCVASPLYKQHFSLATGQCLEQNDMAINTYSLRCSNGIVEINSGDIR